MGMISEFREFAIKGNVVDLAVGVIIGGAFGKIVTSVVNDIVMPPIGKALGNVISRDLYISLDPQKTAGIDSLDKARQSGAAIIAYGSFINAVLDFLIVALCIFLLVKAINRIRRLHEKPAAAAITKKCPYCKTAIAIDATRCPACTSQLATEGV